MASINNFTGFETRSASEEFSASTGSPAFPTSSPNPRSGSTCFGGATATLDFPWVASGITDGGSAYFFGCGVYIETGNTATPLILDVEDDAASSICSVRVNADGTLTLLDANASTLDTSASSYEDDTWHYVEVYAQLNSGTANWEWFIDGNSQGSGSSADLTDANGFGASSSSLVFSTTANVFVDDAYIMSGVTAVTDRIGPLAYVKGYQSGVASGTDNGDALLSGQWGDTGDTPFSATGGAESNSGTWSGSTTFDASNTAGLGPGPSGDGDITGMTIKAAKFIAYMRRSTGPGATSQSLIYGNSVDTPTTSADLSLGTSDAVYTFLSESATVVPTASEYFLMGMDQVGGNQEIISEEMWATLLFFNPDITVAASTDTLALTENQATISNDIDVQATTDSLVVTEQNATVQLILAVNQPSTVALTLTENQADIRLDEEVFANTDALTLAGQQATRSLDIDVQAASASLTLATYQANITLNISVAANTDALTLATLQADCILNVSITAGIVTIDLTTYDVEVSRQWTEITTNGNSWNEMVI